MTATVEEYSDILYEVKDAVARVTINRPDKLNAFTPHTVKELAHAIWRAGADSQVGVIVLTGAGERAFSAGGDLKGYLTLYDDAAGFRTFLRDFDALCAAIEASSKLWIAAVNGVTVAGGLEVMLACDVVLAADDARIGDGHSNFAQLPGAGGSQRLPRAIGALRAKRLLLTGELLTAAEAERIGLVTAVVPAADLQKEALAWAARFEEKSPACLRGMKYLVNEGLPLPVGDALRMEQDYVHAYATGDPDAREGLNAFAEKRPPRYRQPG